jgi:hypothetical protein
MTTTSKTFNKVNDIFQCKLTLEDGKEFTIPLREDGYIFATGLCKAVGKRVYDWLRLKETKNFKTELENKLKKNDTIIPVSQLIEVYKGNTSKYSQGTWVHPDLGLNLAQWCSPNFSLQVSKWLRELIFTGSVQLENEKSDEKIKEEYDKILTELNKTKDKLKNAESIIISQENQNLYLSKKYNKLYENHQAYLKRKELYKLKEGPCVYLVNMLGLNDNKNDLKIKIGQTGNISDRISGFRTSSPYCKLLFVIYTNENIGLEKFMKIKYDKELRPNNSEFISGVEKDVLINDLINIAGLMNLNYNIEDENELEKFNGHIISFEDIEENEIKEVVQHDKNGNQLKRCGGITHETEESRMLTLDNFYKNSGNKDGVNRLCKDCYVKSTFGDKRKRRKIVAIPKYDSVTHKWCNLCENVKEHKSFNNSKDTKDGLYANCKECKKIQKINYIKRKKELIMNS